MRFVVQRVTQASVTVDGDVVGEIDKGFMVLIGVSLSDQNSFLSTASKKSWIFRLMIGQLFIKSILSGNKLIK